MIRPRKMKQIELTVMRSDVDQVIEFLGRRAMVHFSQDSSSPPGSGKGGKPPEDEAGRPLQGKAGESLPPGAEVFYRIRENLEKLQNAASYLEIELPQEALEETRLPGEAEAALTETITSSVFALNARENEDHKEERKVEEALNEARAFANLNAPFTDLDQLSYLTLRIGRLDPKEQERLREKLADRAVIISLGPGTEGDKSAPGDRVLAAASRKGRFALDSELKKLDFQPITIPEGYKGVPEELLAGLEAKLKEVEKAREETLRLKGRFHEEYALPLRALTAAWLMAEAVEQLKERLVATKNIFLLSGWIPADELPRLVDDLAHITEGRVAIRAFSPEEIPGVKEGREKVPVSLKHGTFVKGFEGVVFSYGAPLYGTIDPTPFVAFSFTLLFGLMFGDLGQGFVLFLLGLLTGKKGPRFLAGFRKFSVPLIAVGISSMVMGLLTGEVFTNEELLAHPTEAVTGFLTGKPVERVLTLMPLPEKGGSVTKLFYFFGFTVGVGVILNSLGLLVNIANNIALKRYEKAFFAKTGLAGALLFWYALFIALRCVLGGRLVWADALGLAIPALSIFLGPVLWRLISREKPLFAEGILVFFMEGFVEILETASTYVSNTVSFLRVGAFALSHAVLSYIVFRFSEEVAHQSAGTFFSLLILIFGNTVIILLEGMIVAIQVVRLQYYEFFSKFFTETGVEFAPFRFRGMNNN